MITPTPGIDGVLAATRPAFDGPAVVGISAAAFGVRASSARDLGSERDQTFLLLDADETPVAVMKVSNTAERVDILDMEALAAFHVHRVDPDLPVALPRRGRWWSDRRTTPGGLPDRRARASTATTTSACTTSCRATNAPRPACSPIPRSSAGARRSRGWGERCAASSTPQPDEPCSGTSSTRHRLARCSTPSPIPTERPWWFASSIGSIRWSRRRGPCFEPRSSTATSRPTTPWSTTTGGSPGSWISGT